nr:retrotransposon protein, putative, unclassified [Tanacetum cinerariifolium]
VDHAGCIYTRKSTFGRIQFLGDKLASWMSKKQDCTAMSSAVAEYVALSASCAQLMWMRTQLQDYGLNYNNIPLYCNSHQPDGFVDKDNPNHVYKLKKALYGLKQAPCAWYDLLLKFLLSQEFSKGTVDPILFIRRQGKDILMDSSIALTAYKNVDHAGCQDTRRSTSGSMQLLRERLVSWSSKRQKSVAIFSAETEYIAFAIALCCKNVQHSRSKHINIRFHFIKEKVENGVVELYFVNIEYQLADIFTKALCRERIEFLINKLGMRSFTSETLKQLADEAEE